MRKVRFANEEAAAERQLKRAIEHIVRTAPAVFMEKSCEMQTIVDSGDVSEVFVLGDSVLGGTDSLG